MWTWLALHACVGDPKGDGSLDSGDPPSADSAAPHDTGAASEDCANGADDDRDGLLDCEDEDCELAAGCSEADCTDALDDDADGRVDCDDDDCWSAACEGHAWARVNGGSLVARHDEARAENHYFGGTGYCGFDSWAHARSSETWRANATGTVRFVQAGLAEVCTWSADARISRRYRHSEARDGTFRGSTNSVGSYVVTCNTTVDTSFTSSPMDLHRELALEEGCALARSDFLPALSALALYAPAGVGQGAVVNTAAGRVWYGGPVEDKHLSVSSTLSGAFSEAFSRMEPLDGGATWATGP